MPISPRIIGHLCVKKSQFRGKLIDFSNDIGWGEEGREGEREGEGRNEGKGERKEK